MRLFFPFPINSDNKKQKFSTIFVNYMLFINEMRNQNKNKKIVVINKKLYLSKTKLAVISIY